MYNCSAYKLNHIKDVVYIYLAIFINSSFLSIDKSFLVVGCCSSGIGNYGILSIIYDCYFRYINNVCNMCSKGSNC